MRENKVTFNTSDYTNPSEKSKKKNPTLSQKSMGAIKK